ncbi:MAG: cation:proton antiporter, partial [Acetobacteraceae bacterium]
MFPNPWVLMVCTFGLLIVLGTTSGVVRSRLWVSEPLICAIAGIALGPWGAGLIRLSPGSDSVAASVLEEVARVTLGIAVIGAAMRLPSDWLRQNWRGLAIILGPVMAMMWVVSGGLAFAILQLPLLTALMIAAAITPTDPVLSAPVLTGRLAETAVPPDVRHSLTAESGINDGLALPLVLLMILLTD